MSAPRTQNLLGALSGAVAERLEPQDKGHPNQTDSSVAALKLIAQQKGCSNVALSQALGLSHPATVRLVDKLEAAGLVKRRPGTDRRTVALHPTPAGLARLRAVLEQRGAALEDVVALLTPEQRRQLDGIAETLLRGLTATPLGAAHTCRLCDEGACPPARCPVHIRAHELLAPLTQPQAARPAGVPAP